jgi:tetratricopeptide (TPR) repeat protein
LGLQGRWREAMALEVPANEPQQAGFLLCEQAVIAHQMGDKQRSRKLLDEAIKHAEPTNKDGMKGQPNMAVLAARLKAGKRMTKPDEAIDEVGQVLDRFKPAAVPSYLLSELAARDDSAHLSLWWTYLRQKQPDAALSSELKLLAEWFVKGKADKDFDTTLAAAEKHRWADVKQQERWSEAVVRACVRVGKLKKAEDILKTDIEAVTRGPAVALAYHRLGRFYFEQKRWADADSALSSSLKSDPTAALTTYLRGVALLRLKREKEGKTLIDRARLLPLASDLTRYDLAVQLERLGLADEAAAERLLLCRTSAFRSIQASNASSALGNRAARQKRFDEAARCYRRMLTNIAFGGSGYFIDERAYLMVPGWAHLFEARARADAGKLDDALAEARRAWDHLPEETSLVGDLVRALEKADRKSDAERLFDERFALLQRACVESPASVDRHNRLAWLAARSGRRLDTALQHAKRSTELMPSSAGSFDTLAEVHFQRGDKDEAVAAIKQAIKLAPKQAYYEAQLKRIEAGDRKADLPSR